jgi:type I restriction enzyme M protein
VYALSDFQGIKAIENLWDKYAVTAKAIEKDRAKAAKQLEVYLAELGYEQDTGM